MAENINKTRLLEILQTLAQGHYEQGQLIKGLQSAGIDEAAVNRLIEARVNTLVNNAPAALDTLKEIADKLAADDSVVAGVLQKLESLQTRLQEVESFTIPENWLSEIQRRMMRS